MDISESFPTYNVVCLVSYLQLYYLLIPTHTVLFVRGIEFIFSTDKMQCCFCKPRDYLPITFIRFNVKFSCAGDIIIYYSKIFLCCFDDTKLCKVKTYNCEFIIRCNVFNSIHISKYRLNQTLSEYSDKTFT